MLCDTAALNPKGWVKVDVYDAVTGEIVQHVENHNVVTNAVSEIVARILSNPGAHKAIRTTVTLNTDTAPDNTGFYVLQLPHHRSAVRSVTLTGTDSKTLSLGSTGRLIRLDKVLVGGAAQRIGIDVWISNEDAGQITFANVIPQGTPVEVDYTYRVDSRVYIEPGSEVVTVGAVTYERSNMTDAQGRLIPEDGKYVIDEETGRIWFNQVLEGVTVTYTYKMVLGVVFMGISDRPAGHPVGQPIVFTDADKGKLTLDAEYAGARQPIIFPAEVTTGSTYQDTIVGNGIDTVFTLSHRNLLTINSVYNVSKGVAIPAEQVTIFDAPSGRIKFATPPAATDVIRITYTWNSGSTVTFIADFPPEVPGPQKVSGQVHTFTTGDYNSDGTVDRIYQLPYAPDEVVSVMLGQTVLTPGADYSVNGNQLVLNSTPPASQELRVTYNYTKQTADIYEVGLFTDEEGGLMFAISGIGPITKSTNMGVRVTWSVTF